MSNHLPNPKKTAVIHALIEGCSVRSTARLTGVCNLTILNLLVEVGEACAKYQDAALRNLRAKRIQCDEIWSFVGCKQKRLTMPVDGRGDTWTWIAMDEESKLIPCWHVGQRDYPAAYKFINDLASRLISRVQITTDGYRPYIQAIEDAFGSEVDYAMVVKMYEGMTDAKTGRHIAEVCTSVEKKTVFGNPDPKHICTSHLEKQNHTFRMHCRRLSRLTNAFSKKIENHRAAIALYFMFYNFCRIHSTIRCTPAMQAGVSDHVWEIAELVNLIERK